MRASPPLQISVTRSDVWRYGVLLLAATACAAMLAWWWSQPVPAPLWATASAVLGSLATWVCVGGLWRQRPLTLRWDGQRWQCAHDGAAERAGELAVAVDLGGWMLLCFHADSPVQVGQLRQRKAWIALQRRGLEAQWHALRCAVYAARPAAQPDVAGAGPA